VAVAHGGAVGVVLAFRAGQPDHRLLHQGLHDLQPGADGQRQQAFLGRLGDLGERDGDLLGHDQPGHARVDVRRLVLLARWRSPSSRCSWRITRDLPDGRAQVGDRHLNLYESRDNLPAAPPGSNRGRLRYSNARSNCQATPSSLAVARPHALSHWTWLR
jgi:hypothetical protein